MILFLIVFGVILYAVEKYSMKHGLDRVSLSTSVDKVLVEPDEPFTWTMTVKNAKRMLVPYLKISEQVPRGLLFDENNELMKQWADKLRREFLYIRWSHSLWR